MVQAGSLEIATLRERCQGEVFVAGDAGYDEARAIWNGNIDKHPKVFVFAGSACHYVAVIRYVLPYRGV